MSLTSKFAVATMPITSKANNVFGQDDVEKT